MPIPDDDYIVLREIIKVLLETDEPLTDAELQRVTALIKEAIGFNIARGDSISVINTVFQTLPEPEPLPETPLLEQPWLWDVLKQALGIGLFLFVIFGVLKPILKSRTLRHRSK